MTAGEEEEPLEPDGMIEPETMGEGESVIGGAEDTAGTPDDGDMETPAKPTADEVMCDCRASARNGPALPWLLMLFILRLVVHERRR